MIRLNPEHDYESAQAIRWARERSMHRSQVEHVVSIWASFRNSFSDLGKFLEAVCKDKPHLYAEYFAAIYACERQWKRTEGLTDMMRRVRR